MIKKIVLIIITLSFFLMSIINIPKTHALEDTFYQEVESSYLENINNRVYSSSSDNGLYWLIDETTFYNNYPAKGYAVRIDNEELNFTSGDLSTLIDDYKAVVLSTLYQSTTYYIIDLKYFATQKYPVTWTDNSTLIWLATEHDYQFQFILNSTYISTGNNYNKNYYERMQLYFEDFKLYLSDSKTANYNNGAEMGYWYGYNDGYNDGHAIGYNAGLYENNDNIYNAGYDAGYDAGSDAGYDAGYDAGLQKGLNDGYYEGLDAGANLNPSIDWIKSLFIGMGAFLSVEIFPNVTIGLIVAIPLLFSLLLWFVKLIRG